MTARWGAGHLFAAQQGQVHEDRQHRIGGHERLGQGTPSASSERR
ncbi:MAG: hypothetical protein R3D53_13525 [Paracoccaceae bacterium]